MTRRPIFRRPGLVLGSLAAVLVLLVTGCSDDSGFDARAVEDHLVAKPPSLLTGASITDASCPDDVKVVEGVRFRCRLRVGEHPATVEVTLTDVDRDPMTIATRTTTMFIPADVVEQYVKGTIGTKAGPVVVACGRNPLPLTKGVTARCSVRASTQKQTFTVRVKNASGALEIIS